MTVLLNTLYVTTPDAYLRLEGETVCVMIEEVKRLQVPLHHLGALVLFGHAMLSPALLGRCAEDGRSVVWLDRSGRFKARLEGPVNGNILLRLAQYRAADLPAQSLPIVRAIVAGKLRNSRQLLMRADFPFDGRNRRATAPTPCCRFSMPCCWAIAVPPWKPSVWTRNWVFCMPRALAGRPWPWICWKNSARPWPTAWRSPWSTVCSCKTSTSTSAKAAPYCSTTRAAKSPSPPTRNANRKPSPTRCCNKASPSACCPTSKPGCWRAICAATPPITSLICTGKGDPMLVLVSYDVSTETREGRRRLRQVAKVCLNHGQRVQKSVFECKVDLAQLETLKHRLLEIIELAEDNLRIYRISEPLEKNVMQFGKFRAVDFEDTLIV